MIWLLASLLAFASAPPEARPLPARDTGGVLPQEYERDGIYELYAFYDPRLDAWRTTTSLYGSRWRSQVPHPVALRDVAVLGDPAGHPDYRVWVRIRGRAWVRENRGVGYRWTVGFVGDVVHAEPVCQIHHIEAPRRLTASRRSTGAYGRARRGPGAFDAPITAGRPPVWSTPAPER